MNLLSICWFLCVTKSYTVFFLCGGCLNDNLTHIIIFAFIHNFRYTAISVLEMDFDRIDINQCPKGKGNIGPNRFADTARCKKDTTEVYCVNLNILCLINYDNQY